MSSFYISLQWAPHISVISFCVVCPDTCTRNFFPESLTVHRAPSSVLTAEDLRLYFTMDSLEHKANLPVLYFTMDSLEHKANLPVLMLDTNITIL